MPATTKLILVALTTAASLEAHKSTADSSTQDAGIEVLGALHDRQTAERVKGQVIAGEQRSVGFVVERNAACTARRL